MLRGLYDDGPAGQLRTGRGAPELAHVGETRAFGKVVVEIRPSTDGKPHTLAA
jgi:hypothetical protein